MRALRDPDIQGDLRLSGIERRLRAVEEGQRQPPVWEKPGGTVLGQVGLDGSLTMSGTVTGTATQTSPALICTSADTGIMFEVEEFGITANLPFYLYSSMGLQAAPGGSTYFADPGGFSFYSDQYANNLALAINANGVQLGGAAGTGYLSMPTSTTLAGGGISFGDINLYRSAANAFKIDVDGAGGGPVGIYFGGIAGNTVGLHTSADAFNFQNLGGGVKQIRVGSIICSSNFLSNPTTANGLRIAGTNALESGVAGAASDVFLYRSGANAWKMDKDGASGAASLSVTGEIIGAGVRSSADPTATAGQTGIGITTGIGNGAATNLTALAKGTGSGPATLAVSTWVRATVGATTGWIPFFV